MMHSLAVQDPLPPVFQCPAWPGAVRVGGFLGQGTAIWEGGNVAAATACSIMERSSFATSGSVRVHQEGFVITTWDARETDTHWTKNAAAIRLLDSWLADESGYDEKMWPIVKKMIEDNRLSPRSRFGE